MARPSNITRGVSVTVALMLANLLAGCGRDPDSPLSPTVSAESETGVKARGQDQRLREQRQRQEANLRRRHPKLPAGE